MQTVRRKLWYSLAETAQRIGCNTGDVLHYGAIGKLNICFDWPVLLDRAKNINPACACHFYYPVDDFFAGPGYQVDIQLNPLRRLATLSTSDIQRIQIYGYTIVESACVGALRMDTVNEDSNQFNENEPPFMLERENILIPNYSIKKLLADKISYGIEHLSGKTNKHTHQQEKYFDNQKKIIGLLTKALSDKHPSSKKGTGGINVLAIARRLEPHKPENDAGLSIRSITNSLSEGLRLLDE